MPESSSNREIIVAEESEDDDNADVSKDEEDEEEEKKKKNKKRWVVVSPLAKVKQQIKLRIIKRKGGKERKQKQKSDAHLEKSNGKRNRFWGKRITCGYCCFCVVKPETSVESPTSDPNDENFTSEMLRDLIERNDFYSKECNPHF